MIQSVFVAGIANVLGLYIIQLWYHISMKHTRAPCKLVIFSPSNFSVGFSQEALEPLMGVALVNSGLPPHAPRGCPHAPHAPRGSEGGQTAALGGKALKGL